MERVDRDDSAGDATLGAGSGADIGVGRFVLTDPDIDIDLDEDVDCMEVDPLMGGGGKVCSLMEHIICFTHVNLSQSDAVFGKIHH